MFQRIQSLYLIALLLINLISLALVPLWRIGEDQIFFKEISTFTLLIAMICGATLAALLQFKTRPRQMAVNRLNLLINLIFMGIVLVLSYEPQLGWIDQIKEGDLAMDNGGFLPMANIVLLFLANKSIRKDEELVKSVDRIR